MTPKRLTLPFAALLIFLCLSACASRPSLVRIIPPSELMADCIGRDERTVGEALENRFALIQCERDKNARLREWAAEEN